MRFALVGAQWLWRNDVGNEYDIAIMLVHTRSIELNSTSIRNSLELLYDFFQTISYLMIFDLVQIYVIYI